MSLPIIEHSKQILQLASGKQTEIVRSRYLTIRVSWTKLHSMYVKCIPLGFFRKLIKAMFRYHFSKQQRSFMVLIAQGDFKVSSDPFFQMPSLTQHVS